MALTAQYVHDIQFKLVRQSTGYDMDEVDAFLEEVEAELRRLHAELEDARGGSTGADTPGKGSGGAGGDAPPASSAPAAEASTSAAARILELAQRTADEYVAEAQRRAEGIRSEVTGLEERVIELRAYESEVRGRLSGYLRGELDRLRQVLGDD